MQEPAALKAQQIVQDWRGGGLVLIVDDEPEVRAVVGRMVERQGFEVLRAEDGRIGLELFRTHADTLVCVLLDMTMPHIDGAETFRRMHQAHPDVPVILMSGYSEHDAMLQFAGKGLAGFLQKPFRPQELAALLQPVLG